MSIISTPGMSRAQWPERHRSGSYWASAPLRCWAAFLDWGRLHNAEIPSSRNDLGQVEAGRCQHIQVTACICLVGGGHAQALRYDPLHEEQFRPYWHGAAAVVQDDGTLLVVPVVEDPFQHVGISSARHSLEEVTSYALAAVRQAGACQMLSALLDDAG